MDKKKKVMRLEVPKLEQAQLSGTNLEGIDLSNCEFDVLGVGVEVRLAMRVVNATMEDINGWLELASEVEYLFGPMVDDPKFIQALEKNINQNRAFCVREHQGLPGSRLLGGVLFSSSNAPSYKIGWLSVSTQARNKGVATALLEHILALMETPEEITVTTFGEDNLDGQLARGLYEKFGFIPQDEVIPNGPEGGSRQKFRLTIAPSD